MSVTHSVAHILRERVTLTVESIDRMYLNVYVPKLQRVLGVVGFFREQRGATFASSALMEPITTAFVKALERFAQTEGVPLVTFRPGQRKDDVAQAHLAAVGEPEVAGLPAGPEALRGTRVTQAFTAAADRHRRSR